MKNFLVIGLRFLDRLFDRGSSNLLSIFLCLCFRSLKRATQRAACPSMLSKSGPLVPEGSEDLNFQALSASKAKEIFSSKRVR